MTETGVAIVVQQAKKKYPEGSPGIISDNGPKLIAKDVKELGRTMSMSHVLTSAYHPRSNGKIERFHQKAKRDCIHPRTPLSRDEAKRIVGDSLSLIIPGVFIRQ